MGEEGAVHVSNYAGQHDRINVKRSAYAGFHLLLVMTFVLGGFVYLMSHVMGG